MGGLIAILYALDEKRAAKLAGVIASGTIIYFAAQLFVVDTCLASTSIEAGDTHSKDQINDRTIGQQALSSSNH